jgi:hypothetical protein
MKFLSSFGNALADATVVSLLFVVSWNAGASPALAVALAAIVSVALPWRVRAARHEARLARVVAAACSTPGLASATVFAIWFMSWPQSPGWRFLASVVPPIVWMAGAMVAAILSFRRGVNDNAPPPTRSATVRVVLVALFALTAWVTLSGALRPQYSSQEAYWASLKPIPVEELPGDCRFGSKDGFSVGTSRDLDDPLSAMGCNGEGPCDQSRCPTLEVGRDARTGQLVVRHRSWSVVRDRGMGLPSQHALAGQTEGPWLGPVALARSMGIPLPWRLLLAAATILLGAVAGSRWARSRARAKTNPDSGPLPYRAPAERAGTSPPSSPVSWAEVLRSRQTIVIALVASAPAAISFALGLGG